MKTVTKNILRALALRTAAAARTTGKRAAKRMVAATDAALVEVGRAAAQRQRMRAVKAALHAAGRAAAIAGAGTVTVMAVRALRAGVRRVERGAGQRLDEPSATAFPRSPPPRLSPLRARNQVGRLVAADP